ncbi:MAG: nucleotidyltransferase domain-containing protein [Sulfolobales archaeon]|nr:nucleotidyltransferase domain-containing protein [Sulfolobales archaeon]
MLVELQALDKLMMPKWIKEILRDFLTKAKNSLGHVEVYIFGSYARGNWLHNSDVDLIVISPAFRNLNISERHVLIRRMLLSIISSNYYYIL